MKNFMDEDFLLTTEASKKLFHDYAEDLPIIDYHCHIDPQAIFEDRLFEDMTEVWLGGDHYKWRIMRACGFDEALITGDAPGRDKFQAFAESLEQAIGNPLYHWSHLELKRYFGYDGALNKETAGAVYDLCNEQLSKPEFSVRNLIRRSKVNVICTTDDPVDSLIWHEKIAADPTVEFKVYPAWRPDKMLKIADAPFVPYIEKLSEVSGVAITSFDTLKEALSKRLDFFAAHGCRVSDHGIDAVPYTPCDEAAADAILKKALAGETLTADEVQGYQTACLLFLGREYAKRGFIMQIHYSCMRNINRRMFEKIGPDTGFDAIASGTDISKLAAFLNALDSTDELPKTIVYSLNPNDNAVIESVVGSFQGGIAGKMQHGSAWWFNDHKPGMTEQLESFASTGVLGTFIGMLTDSRSFLSYTRHEYFRRILCEFVGNLVENGEYPADYEKVGGLIRNICYNNAEAYFGF